MELQGIRYFVEVCRTGSFTKAAENCFVSEPALSRKIKQLERQWGLILFHRTTHSVTLTKQGKILWEEAENLLREQEKFQNLICELNDRKTLRLGYSTQGDKIYLDQIAEKGLRQLFVDVEMQRVRPVDCIRKLDEGRLDACLLSEPLMQAHEGLEGAMVCCCGVGAFVPTDSELAAETEISIRQLEPYPIVTFPRFVGPANYDRMMALAQEAGVHLNVVAEVTNTTPFRILIEEEKEIGLMLDTSRVIESEKIKWVAVREYAGCFNLMLVWRSNHPMAELLKELGRLYRKP